MQKQQQFERIAQAIQYIQKNFKEQPTLDDVAAHIHLSPTHFQRLFSEWVGTSPKKFLQFTSLQYAKSILKQRHENTILDATFAAGMSSSSRIHDLFVQIEGMSPAEYKRGGENLTINYQYADTIFGAMMIASTTKGICFMAFIENRTDAYGTLIEQFPNAEIVEKSDELQNNALKIFSAKNDELSQIKLHLKGTDFQLKVWESLLKIPMGYLASYGDIAHDIGHPKAPRAVGTAIGLNPVAFLIPCHRVIQATGVLGEYRWGQVRKTAIIGWEGVKMHGDI